MGMGGCLSVFDASVEELTAHGEALKVGCQGVAGAAVFRADNAPVLLLLPSFALKAQPSVLASTPAPRGWPTCTAWARCTETSSAATYC